MTTESDALILAWERALISMGGQISPDAWEEAMRQVQPIGTDDDYCDAFFAFEAVAKPFRLGQLVIDFVDSRFGDAATVTVYLLPKGTAVGVLYSTWETERKGFVLERADLSGMLAAAEDLLYSVQDGADWEGLGDWDDEEWVNPDGDTIRCFGIEGIRSAWNSRRLGEVAP